MPYFVCFLFWNNSLATPQARLYCANKNYSWERRDFEYQVTLGYTKGNLKITKFPRLSDFFHIYVTRKQVLPLEYFRINRDLILLISSFFIQIDTVWIVFYIPCITCFFFFWPFKAIVAPGFLLLYLFLDLIIEYALLHKYIVLLKLEEMYFSIHSRYQIFPNHIW